MPELTLTQLNAKLRLLVVDDDADQRELISETLEDHFGRGTVTCAASYDEAMRHNLSAFDLILSDYNLPGHTGLDLLEAVRSRCSTPVIIVTGENVGKMAIEAIKRGATDYVVEFGDYLFTVPLIIEKNLMVAKVMQENESLRLELESALREVREKNTQLERSLQREKELAATDPLTTLYNRRHLNQMLDRLFAEAQRYDQELACVMIDLDGYKRLNDKFGHQVGDQLLVSAGKIISANMRRMDIAARYGGDEFVLLLPHTGATQAAAVAQRIRDEFFAISALLLDQPRGVTMSIGIASLPGSAPTCADDLVAQADAALYEAKAGGRDRIETAPAVLAPV